MCKLLLEFKTHLTCSILLTRKNLIFQVSMRFCKELTGTTSSNKKQKTSLHCKKQPTKPKVPQDCLKSQTSSQKIVKKQMNVQKKSPNSDPYDCGKGQASSPTIDKFLKKNSISYLGAVSFSEGVNQIDEEYNPKEVEDVETESNNKEQTFALMLVFTKSEMPCLMNVEFSPYGCVVTKNLTNKHQESETGNEDDGTLKDDCSLEPSVFYGAGVKSSNRRNLCCIFCGELSSNLFEHWKTQHVEEDLVKDLLEVNKLSTEDSIKERKRLMARLKNEGDYNKNRVILQNPFWLEKTSFDKFEKSVCSSKADDLIVCQVCKDTLLRKNVSTHLKTCVPRPNENKVEKNITKSTDCTKSVSGPEHVEEVSETVKVALNSVNTPNQTENCEVSLSSTNEEEKEMKTTKKSSDIFPWAKRIRGKHYCVYCKHLVYQFRNHMLKAHKREGKITHYNRLLRESRPDTVQERNQIIEDLCEKGDRIYYEKIEKDPSMIRVLSSKLHETLPPQKRKYSDQYERCRKCGNYFSEEELIEHLCEESGHLTDQEENDSFDWITQLTLSDYNSKVQISENLYLIGGSNEHEGTNNQEQEELLNSTKNFAPTSTNNENNSSKPLLTSMFNQQDKSEQKSTLSKENSLTLKTTMNNEAGLEPSTAQNKASSSKPITTPNNEGALEQSTAENKAVSPKQITTPNIATGSEQNTLLNKEVNPAQKTTFYHYDSSDPDDYMFRRRKLKPWTQEEKSLVINEFKHFIMSRSSPGTTRCTDLIEKNEVLWGRNAMQINTMIDNINRGKLKLPSEFQYLQVYRSMYDSD